MVYPNLAAYSTRSFISFSLMHPSPSVSAWWRARCARQPGISAPRCWKACFSSALLSWPSPLVSWCLKISFNCCSGRGDLLGMSLGKKIGIFAEVVNEVWRYLELGLVGIYKDLFTLPVHLFVIPCLGVVSVRTETQDRCINKHVRICDCDNKMHISYNHTKYQLISLDNLVSAMHAHS